jgi:hypothetical protein
VLAAVNLIDDVSREVEKTCSMPGANLEVATLLEEFRKKIADFDSQMYQQGCHFHICAWVAPGIEHAKRSCEQCRMLKNHEILEGKDTWDSWPIFLGNSGNFWEFWELLGTFGNLWLWELLGTFGNFWELS